MLFIFQAIVIGAAVTLVLSLSVGGIVRDFLPNGSAGTNRFSRSGADSFRVAACAGFAVPIILWFGVAPLLIQILPESPWNTPSTEFTAGMVLYLFCITLTVGVPTLLTALWWHRRAGFALILSGVTIGGAGGSVALSLMVLPGLLH